MLQKHTRNPRYPTQNGHGNPKILYPPFSTWQNKERELLQINIDKINILEFELRYYLNMVPEGKFWVYLLAIKRTDQRRTNKRCKEMAYIDQQRPSVGPFISGRIRVLVKKLDHWQVRISQKANRLIWMKIGRMNIKTFQEFQKITFDLEFSYTRITYSSLKNNG